MRIVSLFILFLLSAGNARPSDLFFSPGRIVWLTLFVYLAASLAYRWTRAPARTAAMKWEGAALSLLSVNAVVQQTGGVHSYFLYLYPVVLLIASFQFSFFRSMILVSGIFFLEGVSLSAAPPADPLSQWMVFFPLALIVIPLTVKWGLRAFYREREMLMKKLKNKKMEAAVPLPDMKQRPELARLSKEEEKDEAQMLAKRMEAHLEHLLGLILASRMQAHRAVFLSYDREGELLWVRAARGRQSPLGIDLQRTIPLGEGILGWIAKERRAVAVADLPDQKEPLDYDDGSVVPHSLLAVPVLDQDLFEGLLCVDSLADHAFSIQDEEVLQGVAREIVTVLTYYREQQRMSQRTRVYSALLEISKSLGSRLDLDHRLEITADSAKEIIDYDRCFIFLVEPGERRLTVKAVKGYDPAVVDYNFALTNGLLSIIVKNRQVLLFSQLPSQRAKHKIFPDGCKISVDCRSFLGLPLIIEDRAMGVVLFLSEKENAFTTYDRHVLSILCNHVAISIAEAQAHAQVERLAITDGLTGVYNHRRFQERLQEEFVRNARHPEPFSILMIDIDFFKKINDTFGHPAGDAVLKVIAKLLAKMVRKLDVVARYGGEEFVVLLLKTDSMQAWQMAERIRKTIESAPIDWQGQKIEITVSIGVASQPADAAQREELIACADKALYSSKRAGRNRSTLFKDLTQDMYEVG
ncbi:sensor domain-containing diguanylate cyclase [Candidatus Manganitrophus noduliformans]|uniref:diguanylate cyclase n=1 Tax=Candidatus Manganitrophus noduliformans TaxID=2606439 RepID=A0A7X6DQD1_9BACT|nr:diguanylate cyclase [Candidatus Manganitrophus noduliformans]NKE71415.1 diguanylate cyclase [Candidatus Manganitrophus noduliformans]